MGIFKVALHNKENSDERDINCTVTRDTISSLLHTVTLFRIPNWLKALCTIIYFSKTPLLILGVRAVAQPVRQRRRRAGHEEHRRAHHLKRVRLHKLLRRLVPLQQHALPHLGRVRGQGQERGRLEYIERRRIRKQSIQ